MDSPVIVWFRQDLRLADNPALIAAAATGQPILPLYVVDDAAAGRWAIGAASRWWLHHSLTALDASLGGSLVVEAGNAGRILERLINDYGATQVFWNRCYEPWRVERDRKIKARLRNNGIAATSFDGTVLFPPQSVTKADGTPYRVFTPYYRRGCLQSMPAPRQPQPSPDLELFLCEEATTSIASLNLLPDVDWYAEMEQLWTPGEAGAQQRLQAFLEIGVGHYKTGRDRPDKPYVSRLSPHMHFGEMSPHQIWHAVADSGAPEADIDHFQSELGWREFARYLLYHFPDIPCQNFQPKFDRFPWNSDEIAIDRWRKGQTGFPIVDAGMRELWRTGYMHNRVRMIAASFLVKNLLVHWHHGERWFRDTLVDADLANNCAGWQWVAGSGADAAPYFRIFNPVTQGKKFDPDGEYVRKFLPELAALPAKMIHDPFNHSSTALKEHGVTLGQDYAAPIVDLAASRKRALDAFQSLGTNQSR